MENIMKSMKRKAELLKMLAEEMMSGEKDSMMESLHGLSEGPEEAPVKATIMAEDEEGLIEGAKKLPEILSKADAFKKLRLGDKKKDKKDKK